jgi:hypothetical protein
LKRKAALALIAAALPLLALGATPSSHAADAYSVGQSYVRLFQDSIMPGTCGIVLERPRCLADFHAVQAWRGSDPSDAGIERWLADGDISSHSQDWNGSYVSEQGWAQDPTFAWWYTAGALSIAIDLPISQETSDYLDHYVSELTRHPAATPAEFTGLISATGSPFDRAQPLLKALVAAIPVAPYPAFALVTGPAGSAQLGVYNATLQELVDNPFALSRPESRAFAALLLAELQRRHHEYADGLTLASVQAAVNDQVPVDPQVLNETWRKPLSIQVINLKWPVESRNALLLGQLVAQVAYNAAVLKDSNADSGFRQALGQLPRWPSMAAETRADIAALQKLPPAGDIATWKAINQAATRATLDLVGAAAK